MQVGVHARLEYGDAAELVELGGVGLVVEGAGDQHVEAGIAGLASGSNEIGALHGAELRADEDRRALLGLTLHVAAFGADEIARPGRERREGDPVLLVRLLHAGDLEVFQDHFGEGLLGPVLGPVLLDAVDQFVVLVHAQHAVGAEALDREGTGDADLPFVLVGLVVEVLELGLGGDGGVDLLLPRDAGLPPVGVQFLGSLRPRFVRFARDFPFLPLPS